MNLSESKNGFKNGVISSARCSFYIQQKFKAFFKSSSRMSQKGKKDLEIA